MSGQISFIVGEHVWYSRKGEVVRVEILRHVSDTQYDVKSAVGGVAGVTHEGWLSFTKEEADARAKRYREQEHQ